MPLTEPQLVHAIKRNFGGLKEGNLDPEREFLKDLAYSEVESPDQSDDVCINIMLVL